MAAGDYSAAARQARILADRGDAGAQALLGGLYEHGEGVPQNCSTARHFYRLSAAQGYALAQHNLALMYGLAKGGPQDLVLAYMWAN